MSRRSREADSMEASKRPSLKRRRSDSTSTDSHVVNWRQTICDTFGLTSAAADEELLEALGSHCNDISIDIAPEPVEVEPFYTDLYRIRCGHSGTITSEDPPTRRSRDGKDIHLSANDLVTNFDLYVSRNPGISFVVIREFICCEKGLQYNPQYSTKESDEYLYLASEDLCRALLRLDSTPGTASCPIPTCQARQESKNWDAWAFRNLPVLRLLPNFCDDVEKKHAMAFSEYFCNSKKADFESIERLISSGYYTRQSLRYLFIPGDVVVSKSPRGEAYDMGYELLDWPSYYDGWAPRAAKPEMLRVITTNITFKMSSWAFDGNFTKVTTEATSQVHVSEKPESITSLQIIPYSNLEEARQASFLLRGQMYWKCRKMQYVSYEGWSFERLELFDNSRFMIEADLSKTLYRRNPENPNEPKPELVDHLGPEVMRRDEPPSIKFSLTLPTFLWGFNMQDKIWRKLAVANIKEVDWDEEAFENLVIDPDSKDVIQALVTNKIQNSVSTDLVRGKGSGLILLLHGPPGTGKTLTAESVAEHARKPLYRVACGDIGTKPGDVESYLKNVLNLAKSWDCVVLLDEAEVFLQERSLKDIERNALVSVFLRTLEYYDGILILTSNRVGTIDEGFRSRIQLAIQYPKLEQTDRRKIWENFVNRLHNDPVASKDIDTRNLRSNLTELSKFNLNGREIRNAINVARPLAKYEGRKVDFESLKKVIKVQQKFDEYIKDLNEGLDDEKVAREEGKR
ncbi:hypothetical protein F5Y10DRAFT_247183 [Nemania abortiva]|nr:hypothetical protein F5Y10DRAFT_247183 [Nemania abortiva]